ncbi:MAG TPA: hypothetical protein EYP68_02125 [Candidatus Korarchaeota archaeon]|nr:hypothetical protein [Candidatus Korarchaeota archaeon]
MKAVLGLLGIAAYSMLHLKLGITSFLLFSSPTISSLGKYWAPFNFFAIFIAYVVCAKLLGSKNMENFEFLLGIMIGSVPTNLYLASLWFGLQTGILHGFLSLTAVRMLMIGVQVWQIGVYTIAASHSLDLTKRKALLASLIVAYLSFSLFEVFRGG